MMEIAALGPVGHYRTRTRISVADARGVPVLELASVPGLVVSHWIDSLRGSEPLPFAEIADVLRKAADVFEDQQILGDGLDAHEQRVSALTGTPVTIVRECDRLITATLRDVLRAPFLAKPAGCGSIGGFMAEAPRAGAAWCRTGDVFAVNAAGNSPGVHSMWLEALALGYRVVVRPSNRDPLTPFRLITALRRAGVPERQLVMAPCDYATADLIIDRADRALVYGGQSVVDKYRNRRDVLTQGPGRSKLVVAADADRSAGLELALTGALYHAGTACTATTGVLVEEDASGFAGELADALREVTQPRRPGDDEARLPCMPQSDAERLVAAVLGSVDPAAVRLRPTAEVIGHDGTLSAITPAVVELQSPRDPLLSHEMPFPCVWVAPFERGAMDVLDDSLVLALHTRDSGLIGRALDFPAVSNVYQGKPTSWTHPDVPHDAFLGELLMRAKGVAHDD